MVRTNQAEHHAAKRPRQDDAVEDKNSDPQFATNEEGGPSYNVSDNIKRFKNSRYEQHAIKRFMLSTTALSPYKGYDINHYHTELSLPTHVFNFWFQNVIYDTDALAFGLDVADTIRITHLKLKLSKLQIFEEREEVINSTVTTVVEPYNNGYCFVFNFPQYGGTHGVNHYTSLVNTSSPTAAINDETGTTVSPLQAWTGNLGNKSKEKPLEIVDEYMIWNVGDPPLEFNFTPKKDVMIKLPDSMADKILLLPQQGFNDHTFFVSHGNHVISTGTNTIAPVTLMVPYIREAQNTYKKFRINCMVETTATYEKRCQFGQAIDVDAYHNSVYTLTYKDRAIADNQLTVAALSPIAPSLENLHGVFTYAQ